MDRMPLHDGKVMLETEQSEVFGVLQAIICHQQGSHDDASDDQSFIVVLRLP